MIQCLFCWCCTVLFYHCCVVARVYACVLLTFILLCVQVCGPSEMISQCSELAFQYDLNFYTEEFLF